MAALWMMWTFSTAAVPALTGVGYNPPDSAIIEARVST
jgi:hypothetical protein